ncbi:carbohydrate-binding family 9-like protein (plasmid) [Hymenobacter tibetensis]|uniref:Carbohydrate-binding family 9-like protein n=2 Tax=Hymenobacter tibetensis TaxID=497967 RepID=A0ABY4D701_9BACT|nr:carbohydrate-binding family 9-like protein [Hymenobacter tibetensis]
MLWFSDGIKPVVAFAMGYAHNCIYLKFYVQEPQIQAKYRQTNGPVYKDSCVELFIAFNNEATYYNLEFNCLGTGLVGFGENRHKRRLLPGSTVERIKTWASLTVDGQATWELTLAIPAAIFSAHHLSTFEGLRARANFYKGGEELPIPHYLAWNAIQAQQPDFHRPEFFGELQFA